MSRIRNTARNREYIIYLELGGPGNVDQRSVDELHGGGECLGWHPCSGGEVGVGGVGAAPLLHSSSLRQGAGSHRNRVPVPQELRTKTAMLPPPPPHLQRLGFRPWSRTHLLGGTPAVQVSLYLKLFYFFISALR